MRVYVTSKNSGPTWSGPDPVTMLYLGTDINKAEEAVGNFTKYWKEEHPKQYKEIYTALPQGMEFEMIQFYMADGWWYSIVATDIEEKT